MESQFFIHLPENLERYIVSLFFIKRYNWSVHVYYFQAQWNICTTTPRTRGSEGSSVTVSSGARKISREMQFWEEVFT